MKRMVCQGIRVYLVLGKLAATDIKTGGRLGCWQLSRPLSSPPSSNFCSEARDKERKRLCLDVFCM